MNTEEQRSTRGERPLGWQRSGSGPPEATPRLGRTDLSPAQERCWCQPLAHWPEVFLQPR